MLGEGVADLLLELEELFALVVGVRWLALLVEERLSVPHLFHVSDVEDRVTETVSFETLDSFGCRASIGSLDGCLSVSRLRAIDWLLGWLVGVLCFLDIRIKVSILSGQFWLS